ncbi:MAG TPA: pentapeptide repeat-containing protein, partial [Pseudonocardiaceae bacterium]
LRGADLRHADLTGADLRGADLRGADLREALFLVRAQLDAARGDRATRLPTALGRPEHW